MDNIPMRKCSRCKCEYPATIEYFNRHNKGKYGLSTICRPCDNAKNVLYRKQKADKVKQYREKNKERKRITDKKYNEVNKEKIRERRAQYHIENAETRKQKALQYYYQNKERVINQHKEYVAQNIDIVRGYKKKWRENNREKIAIMSHVRRANKNNTEYSLTPEQWIQCLEFFNYKDAYTGKPMVRQSQDHIVPVSKGGAYVRSNIVPCENSINCSKQDSDMEEWFRKQPFFSEKRLNQIYDWINVNDLPQFLDGDK